MGTFIDEYNALSARIVGLYDVAQSVGATASIPAALTTYNLSGYIGSIPGYKHFSDYVQDGLILGWDGIENAGVGTHAHQISAVYDHSGNGYVGDTFLSVDVLNNGWHINGPDAMLAASTECPLIRSALSAQTITVEVVCQRLDWADQRNAIWGTTAGAQVAPKTYIIGTSTPAFFRWKGQWNASSVAEARIPYYNTAYMGTLTVVGAPRYCTFYRDGLSAYNVAIDNDHPNENPSVNVIFRLGGYGSRSANEIIDMNFYCARVYNRILTPSEIAHNRAVDVARFNIQTQVASA